MAPRDAPGRQVGRDAAAFGRPGAVVKNSAFCGLPLNVCQRFFRLVSHAPCFSHRLLNHVCLPPPRPLGGDRDYAGGGQWCGAGLPLASPHRHRRARHRDGALLLKGKLCLVEQLERLAP